MRTRLGISVGLLSALLYFLCLFGGWTPILLVAGYIFLFESDEWLRSSAIKAIVIFLSFTILFSVIDFIPNGISLINDFVNIFNQFFSITLISKIITLINSMLAIIEKLLFLLLGFMALNQKSFQIGFIDRLVEKSMPE